MGRDTSAVVLDVVENVHPARVASKLDCVPSSATEKTIGALEPSAKLATEALVSEANFNIYFSFLCDSVSLRLML
jgi:hypothetical protein